MNDEVLYVSTRDELKELIAKQPNSFVRFGCEWNFQVNENNFTVDCDYLVGIYGYDDDDDYEFIGEMTRDLAKELMNEDVIWFDDVNWDNNTNYMYGFDVKKL